MATSQELRGHTGKYQFKTEEKAWQEARRLIKHNRADVFRINAYLCTICKNYHVGNRGDELLAKQAPTILKKRGK